MKKKIINLIFSIIIIYSFIISVRLLMQNRSLWLDEAMLAKSLSTRSLSALTASPLDLMQSAPVLYLYIVKIITLLFKNTEVTLRVFSLFSYFQTVVLTYFVSRKIKIEYPVIPAAAVSACGILMKYSVEFKPYMCDCAVTLLVILLYMLHRENKLSLSFMTAIFAVIVWLSNPACFFIAAIAISEFFKNIKKPVKSIISGLVLFVSFSMYFIFWLYPVINKGDMTAYWQGQNFPLPTSLSEIRLASDMIHELILPLGFLRLAISLFAIAGAVKNVIEKTPPTTVIYIGILLAAAASVLGMYPIEDRLWLFIYPVIIILCFDFIKNLKSAVFIGISTVIMTSFTGPVYYTNTQNIIIPGEELNPIIEYLSEKDDFIYVYEHSVPTFLYKTNYNPKSNCMLGSGYFFDYNSDIEEITKHNSGYIVISHDVQGRTEGLFEALEQTHEVTVEMNVHDTKLYRFEQK